MNDYWNQYQKSLATALEKMETTTAQGAVISGNEGLQLACQWTQVAREQNRMIHFVGNGASACMSSHLAVDFTKNAGVRALAYNDVAFLTAIGNDFGYDQVFSQPVGWFGQAGDILATISSSGNSPNVLKAIAVAREKGMKIITFSGMKPDNASRKSGDLNFYVPAWTYGIAECSHQVLLHAWLDGYMNVCEWNQKPSAK